MSSGSEKLNEVSESEGRAGGTTVEGPWNSISMVLR